MIKSTWNSAKVYVKLNILNLFRKWGIWVMFDGGMLFCHSYDHVGNCPQLEYGIVLYSTTSFLYLLEIIKKVGWVGLCNIFLRKDHPKQCFLARGWNFNNFLTTSGMGRKIKLKLVYLQGWLCCSLCATVFLMIVLLFQFYFSCLKDSSVLRENFSIKYHII